MTGLDWAPGDLTGLAVAAHSGALQQGGPAYLTAVLRATGVLTADNHVTAITRCEDVLVGGTGRKARLSVRYEHLEPGLHTDLFVKFSRNFEDRRRDSVRHMLESEVTFAALSREPGLPITVPACVFADFHHESGTGILITEAIPFGRNGVERHYEKCLDHEVPALLEHYEAVIGALARLSGAHKAGHLSPRFDQHFPFDAKAAVETDRIGLTADQLGERLERIGQFATRYPQLLPARIRSPLLLAQLAREAPRLLEQESALRRFLFADPDFIALGHWNANIDNAWFWRDGHGRLQCGLIDWARVGQMNVAQALYGCLSGADPAFWDAHLDGLIAGFIREFRMSGGPLLSAGRLKLCVQLVTATMGLAYILNAPAIIEKKIPDLAEAESARDARFRGDEDARVWLHMLTMFLSQWSAQDFGGLPNRIRS